MKGRRLLPLLLMAPVALAYEEPAYETIRQTDRYEIRHYEPYVVAETSVAGGFDRTGNVAFRRLAGYIFGANRSPGDADRAEPVRMNMTVPVTRHRASDADGEATVYRFVMERAYERESLPLPDDDSVTIAEVPGGRFAVMRYRGRITEARFLRHVDLLRAALERDGIETVGDAVSAVYNGPWTLPFLRRNEVMIRLSPRQPAAVLE
ncbi:MAG: heme-binding protein [Gammaproteobacteria bacterium]|nr:heme-binding protein [Gammaproteobacteria bacterium]